MSTNWKSQLTLRRVAHRLILVCIVFLIITLPLAQVRLANAQGGKSAPATEQDATVATEWMVMLYNRVKAETISAPAAARLYGYAGLTVYQAVLPGIPNDISLSGQIKTLPAMPVIDTNFAYDWPSSASGAMKVVLTGLMAAKTKDTAQAFADLFDKQIAARKQAVSEDIVNRSIDYGTAVGQLILTWSQNDNYSQTRNKPFVLPKRGESEWVPTAPSGQAVEPYWGTIRAFGMANNEQCNLPMNMQFSSDPQSTFYAQAMEVKNTRDHLTDEQKAIALFWLDTPGATGAPAGHWVEIENQLVDQLHLKLGKAVEMYALVGMALADAFITCWNIKYQVLLLRPVTYINRYISRSWAPFVQTPMFPEYASGHAIASQSAAEVLTALFGQVTFTDSSHTVYDLPVRSYTSFYGAAYEAAISRIYGGIHYRMSMETGLRMGQCVGQSILTHLQLHPQPLGI